MAILGKRWANRYIRNRGGSAEEKGWNRQRKLDGMEQWHFYVVVESTPVMLQIAPVLPGSAPSPYLWSIDRIVAGIVMAVTLFGFSFYTFLTFTATLVYDYPYQTPPSLAIQALVGRIPHKHHRAIGPLPLALPTLDSAQVSTTNLFKYLRSRIFALWRIPPSPLVISEDVPLVVVVEPIRVFHGTLVDWTNHKADVRCVSRILHYTLDEDVILSSVRFALDLVFYPAIAKIPPTHVLVDLLSECASEGEFLPGKLDQARSASFQYSAMPGP